MSEGTDTRFALTNVPGGATTTTPSALQSGNRPAVLSLSIKEKAALYAAYMPYIKNGGIFVPTSRSYQLGDEVYLILTILDDPAKLPVAGRVVWITPSGGGASKTPGIGVQFPDSEAGFAARKRIEDQLGSALRSVRPTHTL